MIKQALISIKAASCCLCMSVSPTSPKSRHTLSHPDETATDTAFVTLSRTAVETAIAVYTCCYAMPRSPLLLFWRWSTASSVFSGWSARSSHSLFPSPVPNKPPHFCGRKAICLLTYLWCMMNRIWAERPMMSFWQMGKTSPWHIIMGKGELRESDNWIFSGEDLK